MTSRLTASLKKCNAWPCSTPRPWNWPTRPFREWIDDLDRPATGTIIGIKTRKPLPEGFSLVNEASELGPSSLTCLGDILGHTVSYAEASCFRIRMTFSHMAVDPLIAFFLTHIPGWSSPEGEAAQGCNYIGSGYSRESMEEDDAAEAFGTALKVDSSIFYEGPAGVFLEMGQAGKSAGIRECEEGYLALVARR